MPTVFNRTAWSRIRLTGADRVRFLHNQTTNNIEQLAAGQGCYTVFVTSTGRTIDLATVYAFSESLLVVASPGMAQPLHDWMDRYIFFSDKVSLTDESEQTFMFTALGEGADSVVEQLGAKELLNEPLFAHQTFSPASIEAPITVAVGSDLALDGYTIWGPKAQADAVWQAMIAAGAIAGSAAEWERLRVQQGRPAPAHELTDDDNPLEAGLWHSISFEKGCYIGQETIARLNTYQGVKKRLWGLKLNGPADPGAVVSAAGVKVGRLTSVVQKPDETAEGAIALAYLRTKAGGEGLAVEVAGAAGKPVSGEAIALPFIRHEYYAAPDKSR
ncbi:MAG: folate-binding protein [Phormidesmis sp.]